MKKMILTALVVLAAQSSFAGKATVDKASLEKARVELGLERDLMGRGVKAGDAEFTKRLTKAAPKLALKTGLTESTIISLVTNYPEALDAILTAQVYSGSTDKKQMEAKAAIESLFEGLSRKMDMDASSKGNKAVAKTLEILANHDKYPDSMVEFAKSLVKSIETSGTIKEAVEASAKKYADAKGMTVAEWIEKLLNCLKA